MQMNNKLTILAVVHICRFENGKIAEFWDIGQIQPDPLVNENGMFYEKPETIRAFYFIEKLKLPLCRN